MIFVFFFKQKTAYEIYQCDWSSDVCSSDLSPDGPTDEHADGSRKKAKPGGNRAYDSSCPSVSANGTKSASVEAAGIEREYRKT